MLNYKILPEHRLVVVCDWAESSLNQIFELDQRLQSDPCFSKTYDAIMDASHLVRNYTRHEIENLAIRPAVSRPSPIKIAIVAPTDLSFGMSRMYQILTGNDPMVDLRVFRDSCTAMKWLGREDLDIERMFQEIRSA
ncbi:hypothetical protein [uncultured Desulfosarcina sp.]|uniref:hypothetical protein n=1 Tax=uncultured Desulfosarcina sp. TaxID=218289 RepID=UPI0029C79E2D|nr:hypothetical protein [uncultured Desulfosarcina sp.]